MAVLFACSTNQIADKAGPAAGFVAKTAAKGAFGAGKLVAKEAKAAPASE